MSTFCLSHICLVLSNVLFKIFFKVQSVMTPSTNFWHVCYAFMYFCHKNHWRYFGTGSTEIVDDHQALKSNKGSSINDVAAIGWEGPRIFWRQYYKTWRQRRVINNFHKLRDVFYGVPLTNQYHKKPTSILSTKKSDVVWRSKRRCFLRVQHSRLLLSSSSGHWFPAR